MHGHLNVKFLVRVLQFVYTEQHIVALALRILMFTGAKSLRGLVWRSRLYLIVANLPIILVCKTQILGILTMPDIFASVVPSDKI